jgi:hypothetical protein
MKAKIIKVVGWTLGMAFAVYLIMDGKSIAPPHPIKHALIGAAMGLVLGILFALNLKTNKRNSAN